MRPAGTDLCPANVGSGVRLSPWIYKAKFGGHGRHLVRRKRNPSKQQHLSEIYDALPRFMTAFAKADISTVMRDWMVLCLTTGLRRQESVTHTW